MANEAQRAKWRDSQARWRNSPRNKEKEKKRRNRARERELFAAKKRNLETWPQTVISHIRSRAKQQGREFDLVVSDIVVPDICPVLGIPLIAGAEAPLDNRPSIDRFDNNRGYTKDNIRVISHRANHLKRDATVDEMRRILHYMEGDVS